MCVLGDNRKFIFRFAGWLVDRFVGSASVLRVDCRGVCNEADYCELLGRYRSFV